MWPRKGRKTTNCALQLLTIDLADALFKGQKKVQQHRIRESLGVKGTSWSHAAQFPTQASLAGTGCPGPYPVEFWLYPWMETPQLLQAMCDSVWQKKKVFSCVQMEFHVFQFVLIAYCPTNVGSVCCGSLWDFPINLNKKSFNVQTSSDEPSWNIIRSS